ncbi:RNB domain-containing ribonuclease [Thermodesulfobacterium sp. TA1]|uniref:ribonuclease catalytic domain-containing protein n=1 Tax=Thermodesulfobacterium sp. TA1 TaxID=2234087 RepID=UPI0012325293|nr:ribonuclease catalytic domain-containing protein [Thermodesulfobacterium sp. TA1]QER41499.1 RNB domain-containing ribonuclease [Thermodesulfobacterium sp. TA1]
MDLNLLKNRIVDLFYREKITTVYVKDIKGKRLHVVLSSGKEELINHQALISFEEKPVSFKDLNQILQFLKEKNANREKLKDKFNLKDLWEVVVEEGEVFSAKELVELFLGTLPNEDEIAGFLRKVCEEKLYFKLKEPNLVEITSREEVEKELHRREKELEKIKKINQGVEVLKALKSGHTERFEKDIVDFWISSLKDYFLWEDQSSSNKLIKEVLEKAEITDQTQIFDLLVKLNQFDEDENVDLLKTKFPLEFTPEELNQAENICLSPLDDLPREDLTHLETFTIDAEDTEDFDDALSFEEKEDGCLIYVHIAEVAEFINPGTPLWNAALERALTLYLPEKIIPMLPFSLSHERFSLKQGEIRPAMTFKIYLGKEGELKDFQVVLSLIKVKKRLTYNEVDSYLISGDPFWQRLYQIFMNFKRQREERGALAIFLPEVEVKVAKDGTISVFKIEMTPARLLVAEAMVLTNYLGAKFLHQNQLPAIFRSQPKPSEIIENPEESLYLKLLQLRYLAKSELSLYPEYHSGLGLEAYATLSSPIRRFVDLINQHQLKAFLTGGNPLSEKDLKELLPELQTNLQRAMFLQNKREKYFLLKYLQTQAKEQPLPGLVLQVQNKRAKVYLIDFNLTGELVGCKENLTPGQEITVKIEKVNPRLESLRLKLV